MTKTKQLIERACEKHGFAFQRAYVTCLRSVVLRRRQGCNDEQAIFWMAVATDSQQFEALEDALAIISVISD